MDVGDSGRGSDPGVTPAAPWPCVGDPDTWEAAGHWFTCSTAGNLSLLGLVPGNRLMDLATDDPVLVHLTVCRPHLRRVKWWLRSRARVTDDVLTADTAFLMENWQQAVGDYEVPIFAPVTA